MDLTSPGEMSAGKTLRAIRQALGLKQRDLKSDSVSSGYLAVIEQGKFEPSDSIFREILEIIGITTAEFELIRKTPRLLEVLGILVQAEQHYLDNQRDEAAKLLSSCAHDGRNFIRFRVLESEIDVSLGNFTSAELSLMEVFAQMREHSHFGLFDRAIIAYGRLGDRQGSSLKAAVLLSEFRSSYKERLTPAQQALMCAMLIARIGSIGDIATAEQVLADFESKNFDLDPLSAGRIAWGKCNLRLDQGRYSEARENIKEAISLLRSANSESVQLVEGLLISVNALDPELTAEQIRRELDALDKELVVISATAEQYMLDTRRASKALFHASLQEFDQALAASQLVVDTSPSSEQSFLAQTVRARSLAALGRESESIETLRTIQSTLEFLELQPSFKPELDKCVRLARDLGESELALAITLSHDNQVRLPIENLL